MSLDTLSIARELRDADVAPAQAEAIAAAIGRAVAEASATKSDISELRADAKSDIAELRAEIRAGRVEVEAKIDRLEAGLDARFERQKNEIVRWLLGTAMGLAALLIAAIKLI